jgi:hypothetical protein
MNRGNHRIRKSPGKIDGELGWPPKLVPMPTGEHANVKKNVHPVAKDGWTNGWQMIEAVREEMWGRRWMNSSPWGKLTGMWAVERENIGKIWEYGGRSEVALNGEYGGSWGIDWVERAYIGLLFSMVAQRRDLFKRIIRREASLFEFANIQFWMYFGMKV